MVRSLALGAWVLLSCSGDDGVAGSWCGKEVASAEACEEEGQGNDMWYAELQESDGAVTGRFCGDGYANASAGSGCVDVSDGVLEGETLTLTFNDSFTAELTLDGDTLAGRLLGCSTCDGMPCLCDLPVTLYRIE
jgi:hypothetical protein